MIAARRRGTAARGGWGALGAGLIAALLLAPVPAVAQQSYCATHDLPERIWTPGFSGNMTYRVETTAEGRVLIAEGGVGEDEAARLSRALQQYGPVAEVVFNSPGGAAIEGTKMGRIIRRMGIGTRLRADNACISACSYAFLGGFVRSVEPGGYYGIHMFSAADSSAERIHEVVIRAQQLVKQGRPAAEISKALDMVLADVVREIEQDAAQTAAIRARYLIDMSLSLDFMTDAFGTESKSVCFLSRAGLERYNVDNAR